MGRPNLTDTESLIQEVLRRVPPSGATGPAGPTGATGPAGAGASAATAAALGLVKISGTPADPANPVTYVKEQSDTLLAGKETAGAAAAAVATHVGLSDPHTQYVLDTEKGAASGVATLDGSTKLPIAQVPTGTSGSTVPFGNDARFSDARTPTAHKTSHQDGGGDELVVTGLSGVLADPQPPIIGSTGTTAVAGNDSRLTNARTPTAHAASHASGGTDAVTPAAIGAAAATHTHAQADVTGLVTALAGKEPTITTLSLAKGGTAQDNSTGIAQSAFWGGPSGAPGTASYRALVAADVPALPAAKITSGQLALAQGGTGVDASSAVAANAVFAGPSGGAGAAAFRALAAADIPNLSAAKITSGILPIAQGGTGVAAPIIRLTTDNAAIAAAAPTTVVVVGTLVWAMLLNEEWDVEWLLTIANSIATDVFAFNVLPSAGTFTGRYWVEGINGVPSTGAAVAKSLQNPTSTLTVASANAPGNTGTIGLVTMVRVRAVGKQTVAPGNLQVALRAGTSAAASSGTATVKTQSQVFGMRIA